MNNQSGCRRKLCLLDFRDMDENWGIVTGKGYRGNHTHKKNVFRSLSNDLSGFADNSSFQSRDQMKEILNAPNKVIKS